MARVARAVFDRVYILFVLAVTAYAERGFLEPERYSLGEVGSGRTLQVSLRVAYVFLWILQ